MRALSASEFLLIWERGADLLPYERALTLLKEACPEFSTDDVAALSIGHRDSLLLTMREAAFGSGLTALSSCPYCRATAEIEIDTLQLGQARAGQREVSEPWTTITVAEREFHLRAPNTSDVAACRDLDTDGATRRILSRCLTPALPEASVEPLDLSAKDIERAGEAMAAMDPQADLQMEIKCAVCQQPWSERFDIVTFFWIELDAWARRTLREVHTLASAYGWAESEVLSLSAVRRGFYLEMVSA